MAKSKYEVKKPAEHLIGILKNLISAKNRSEAQLPSMELLMFIHAGKNEKEKRARLEGVLRFIESESIKMTSERLFFCIESICSSYYEHFFNSKSFSGSVETANKMIEGLKNIAVRKIQSPKAVNLLLQKIHARNPLSESDFQSAHNTFNNEALIQPNSKLSDSISELRAQFLTKLKSYNANLLLMEWGRGELVDKALAQEKQLSDSEFLVNFMIAYRVFEKYPTSKERKAILLRIFPKDDPFRAFAELFASKKVKFETKGGNLGVSDFGSLEKIFKYFYAMYEATPTGKEFDDSLNKAILNKLSASLMSTKINSQGDAITRLHNLLPVLEDLIYVGHIKVPASDESSHAILKTLINQFAASYFLEGEANPIKGVVYDKSGFLQYFLEITKAVKSSASEGIMSKKDLIACVSSMEKLAANMDFTQYQFIKNSNASSAAQWVSLDNATILTSSSQQTPYVSTTSSSSTATNPQISPSTTASNASSSTTSTQPIVPISQVANVKTFFKPSSSSSSESSTEGLRATKEEAEKLKASILETYEKESDSPGAMLLNNSNLGSLEVVNSGDKSGKLIFNAQGIKSQEFNLLEADESSTHYDKDFANRGMSYFPQELDELIQSINEKWGEGSAIKTSKIVKGGDERFYQYQYGFEISSEKVKAMVDSLPSSNQTPGLKT